VSVLRATLVISGAIKSTNICDLRYEGWQVSFRVLDSVVHLTLQGLCTVPRAI
jgi:hypothetical protein